MADRDGVIWAPADDLGVCVRGNSVWMRHDDGVWREAFRGEPGEGPGALYDRYRAMLVYDAPPPGQSRRGSAVEALTNVAIGYGIAIATQIIVFPWFGIHIPVESNLGIGAVFTVVSLIRSYALRRAFNLWHARR